MSYHHFLLDHPRLLVDTVVHLLHHLVLLLLGYSSMAKLIIVSIETLLSKFWNFLCVEHYSCVLKDLIKIGIIIIIVIIIQPLGRFGQEPESSQATGMDLVCCILGKLLGVVCHCFPPRLDVPTFATRCLHVRNDVRDPSSKRWNNGRERLSGNFAYVASLFTPLGILHAANLRHGTDGFTSSPKEGVLRIFSPLKIRQLWQGLNPRTWVLKASTLPLDHQSHLHHTWMEYFSHWLCKLQAGQLRNHGREIFLCPTVFRWQ